MAETQLENLVINYLSQEQYAKASLENNIDENMLYFTPDLAGGTGTVVLNSTDSNEDMYNKIFSSVKAITNADGALEPRLAKDILYVDASSMPKKYYRAIGVSSTYTDGVCSWISLQFYRADNQQQQYFVLIANSTNGTKSITKTSNWSLTSTAPIDSLDSIDTDIALSANQGRVLNEKIENSIIDNIFYWDGQSSNDNSDNLAIWQEAIEKSTEKEVYIIATGKKYKTTIFRIAQGSVTTTGTFAKMYSGIIEDLWASQAADTGTGISYNMSSVQIEISDFVVTNVYAMGSSVSAIHMNNTRFLPTTGETVDSYEPTYDYHPATKKYVDDLILGALNASY